MRFCRSSMLSCGRAFVLLHGPVGSGKSALAREAAEWLTLTGMFDELRILSMREGERELSLALEECELLSDSRRRIMVLDDADRVPDPGPGVERVESRQLAERLLELAAAGVGVILTTRDQHVFEGLLAREPRVESILVEGLRFIDAHVLAGRVLRSSGIGLETISLRDLRGLLRQLQCHPLSIEQVLPLLRAHPIGMVCAELHSLLAEFLCSKNASPASRPLAAIEGCLRDLDDDLGERVQRLAVFEDGSSEEIIQDVCALAPHQWRVVRAGLEQAGLATVVTTQPGTPAQFLRLHHALILCCRRVSSRPEFSGPAAWRRIAGGTRQACPPLRRAGD